MVFLCFLNYTEVYVYPYLSLYITLFLSLFIYLTLSRYSYPPYLKSRDMTHNIFFTPVLTLTPRIHRVNRWNSVHVDPLSVLDMMMPMSQTRFPHPHLIYVSPFHFPILISYMSPLLLLPYPLTTPHLSLKPNSASYPTCGWLFSTACRLYGFAGGIGWGSHRDRPGLASRCWDQRQPCQCKHIPTHPVPCSSIWWWGWGRFISSYP